MKRYVSIAMLASLGAILIGCGANQLISSAETAVAAAEAITPAIDKAAGIPDSTTALVLNYESAATSCLQSAATAIGSSETVTPVIATQILSGCAKVVAPNLPAGTPQSVVAAVEAVSSALSAFLGQLPKPTAQAGVFDSRAGVASFFAPAPAVKAVHLSKKDKARIEKLRQRIDALIERHKGKK